MAANLTLESTPVISAARCDVISRAWAIIGQLEDLRVDMKASVRQTTDRDRAIDHIAAAVTNLAVGAQLLIPGQLEPAA